MTQITKTTRLLFETLEREGVRYAYLRNWEYLPSLRTEDGHFHTDIDLVVDSRDMPQWCQILSHVAGKVGWDAVTRCGHWARSPVRSHNIDVFRLYSGNPLTCLQIDLFHGFLVHGVPLFDEQALLEGRSFYPAKGVTGMDLAKQNTYHLVQIATLYPESPEKLQRYRVKVMEYLSTEGKLFRKQLSQYFGPASGPALDALARNDLAVFQRLMKTARRHCLLQYARQHLGELPRIALHRLRDHISRFYADPCGSAVSICATQEDRPLIRSVMDELVGSGFMDTWIEKPNGRIGFRDRLLMEQGAWVVTWTEAEAKGEKAVIDLRSTPDREAVVSALLHYAIRRHKALKTTVSCPAPMSYV
jgi:hypothetical protein